MLIDYIECIIGIIQVLVYKVIYNKRIKISSIPKINKGAKFAIKKGSKIHIGKGLRCRNNFSVRVYDSGILKIGNNCFFNDNCSINCRENIKIGDNFQCGQNVLIFDNDHDYRNSMSKYKTSKVEIGNNVWCGCNVVILRGVKIGDNCVIAAGSIVNQDIPDNMLFYNDKIANTKTIKRKEENHD